MDTKSYVIEIYREYFRSKGISLSTEDVNAAIKPFNISRVDNQVNLDIEKNGSVRERYHKSNLRIIIEQYAEQVFQRMEPGTESLTDYSLLNESRLTIKSASEKCDLYLC